MIIAGEGGGVVEYQAVGRDITDRISYEQRIEDLNSELETKVTELRRANEELKTFSYSISHDLKTPILATLGLLRLTRDQHGRYLDDKGKALITGAEKCVRRMEELIDDLLVFFKVRSETVEYVWIDMESLIKEVFDEVSIVNASVPLHLKLEYLPAVQGDAKMIRQVLANLIGNAVKFSRPKGNVVIEVGSRMEEGRVVYFVKDNGVGFSSEDAGRIFRLFERLHSREEFEGTGIGLAIVERVVKRHGGSVWAEGTTNSGATFYFSLPHAGEKVQ
jgi:light-regulated signal transduction histidine kinase (bacteriophytochrome)